MILLDRFSSSKHRIIQLAKFNWYSFWTYQIIRRDIFFMQHVMLENFYRMISERVLVYLILVFPPLVDRCNVIVSVLLRYLIHSALVSCLWWAFIMCSFLFWCVFFYFVISRTCSELNPVHNKINNKSQRYSDNSEEVVLRELTQSWKSHMKRIFSTEEVLAKSR